jgi:hypothetical protein
MSGDASAESVPEPWQNLRVGDRIRFVAMPSGYSEENCHPETLAAYQLLIERRRPVRVAFLDETKRPWIRFRVLASDGRWDHHSLLINHDGWVPVKPRKRAD